jgi:hypothetical protein
MESLPQNDMVLVLLVEILIHILMFCLLICVDFCNIARKIIAIIT